MTYSIEIKVNGNWTAVGETYCTREGANDALSAWATRGPARYTVTTDDGRRIGSVELG